MLHSVLLTTLKKAEAPQLPIDRRKRSSDCSTLGKQIQKFSYIEESGVLLRNEKSELNHVTLAALQCRDQLHQESLYHLILTAVH